jgi:hypothetical protein
LILFISFRTNQDDDGDCFDDGVVFGPFLQADLGDLRDKGEDGDRGDDIDEDRGGDDDDDDVGF